MKQPVWPAPCRCAVSLAYDDSLPVHHTAVAPLLKSKGLTGTFYLSANAGLIDAVDAWRTVAAMGHELGNHSLFHACRRDPPERFRWLAPHNDLCDYTVERWRDEMWIMNGFLRQIDGRTERTFGKPCGNTTVGPKGNETRLDDAILSLFPASRGSDVREIMNPGNINFAVLSTIGGDRKTFEELRALIDQTEQQAGWLILTFHGVGRGTHPSFIETDEHTALVDYLAAHRDRIWSASVLEIAKHLK